MTQKISRRDFLKLAGTSAAGLVLSSCGVKATELPMPTKTITPIPTNTLTPTPSSTPEPSPTPKPTTLRDFADILGFEIGSLIEWWRSSPQYLQILSSNYNYLRLGTIFAWKYMRPSQNKFEFDSSIEKVLDFAQKNRMGVNSDNLIWGTQLPEWLTLGNWTKEQLLEIIETHIKTVLGKYKGKFKRVIVANEIWGNPWESSFWTDKLGDEHVIRAFRIARLVDPNAILAINDFSIEFSGYGKADKMYQYVKKLNEVEQNTYGKNLIDAVGFQMPLLLLNGVPNQGMNVADFTNDSKRAIKMEQFRQNIHRYKDIGVEVFISECFTDITDIPGERDEKLKIQADIYADVLRVCVDEKISFTTYGFHDDINAYPEGAGRPDSAPYAFDEKFNPKPAYYAMIDVLSQTLGVELTATPKN